MADDTMNMTRNISAGCSESVAHPLEAVFPFFRRFRRSHARDLLYTAIWSSMIGLVFALFAIVFDPPRSPGSYAWGRFAWAIFVLSNCIGFVMHAEFVIGDWIFPAIHRQRSVVRIVYYFMLPIFGVFGGWLLGAQVLQWDAGRVLPFTPSSMVSIAAITVIISGVMLAIFIPRERAAHAQAAFERERARVAAAEREATLARLKLLEAQVEPHFLYNTLANAMSLVDSDPAAAKRMLERLIALLRAAAASAEATVTLGRQAELVGAYLDILALRMGSRLAWSIDVPPDLAALPVAPMLLQPVVENAVKHGLEPKLDGGRVDVTARRDGSRLELTVTDTGLGFRSTRDPASTGLGLRNLRARLAALYGGSGTLTIEDRPPSGTRVTVSIPLPAAG